MRGALNKEMAEVFNNDMAAYGEGEKMRVNGYKSLWWT